jgi:hypothetical protein
MPPAEFEPLIPATNRPQSFALDRADTGNGEGIPFLVQPRVFLVTSPKMDAISFFT